MAPSHTLSFFPPDTLTECPHNCHGNGDCRSGTCHCFPGFLGPDCSRGMLSYSRAHTHTRSHTTLQRNKQPMSLFIIGFRLSFEQVRPASRLLVGLNSQAWMASYYLEEATISFISMDFLLYLFSWYIWWWCFTFLSFIFSHYLFAFFVIRWVSITDLWKSCAIFYKCQLKTHCELTVFPLTNGMQLKICIYLSRVKSWWYMLVGLRILQALH